MKIYVGNLAGQTVEADLMRAFEPYGQVERVNIARLSRDGSSREFAYVDVVAEDEGRAAITGLDGTELHGHVLHVAQVHKRPKGR